MPRILCKLFGHRRNSRLAHLSNDGWLAPCVMCGTRLARKSHNRWRVVADDEMWPSFSPYARAPRQPFGSDRGDDFEAQHEEIVRDRDRPRATRSANDEICSTVRGGGRRDPLGEPDRTRRLLHDLFEQAPITEQTEEPDPQGETATRAPRRDQANGRSEAEMFAIAFACCREMLFRLSDHFSLQKMDQTRADEAPPVNR